MRQKYPNPAPLAINLAFDITLLETLNSSQALPKHFQVSPGAQQNQQNENLQFLTNKKISMNTTGSFRRSKSFVLRSTFNKSSNAAKGSQGKSLDKNRKQHIIKNKINIARDLEEMNSKAMMVNIRKNLLQNAITADQQQKIIRIYNTIQDKLQLAPDRSLKNNNSSSNFRNQSFGVSRKQNRKQIHIQTLKKLNLLLPEQPSGVERSKN